MIQPEAFKAAIDYRQGMRTADKVQRYLIESKAEKTGIVANNRRELHPEIQSALKAYDMLQSKGFDTKLAMATVCLAMDAPPGPCSIDELYKRIKSH